MESNRQSGNKLNKIVKRKYKGTRIPVPKASLPKICSIAIGDTSNVTIRRRYLDKNVKKMDKNEPPLIEAGPSGKDAEILKPPVALKSDTSCTSYMKIGLIQDYDTDVFTHLLEGERRIAVPKLDSQSRACVINWIIKVNGNQGNPTVVQVAISFLDTFLAMRKVDVERLQLAAAACFWLAQKNLGTCLSASELVEASDRAFFVSELAHAEITIIRLLKFPPTPIVPQDFISYLAWISGTSKPEEVEVAATFICASALLADTSLSYEYPSVIAAAAVRNAVLCLGGCLAKLRDNAVYNMAESKALDFCYVCRVQQKAVCKISASEWKFKAPLETYSTPPQFVAHRIVSAAAEMQDIKFENMDSDTP